MQNQILKTFHTLLEVIERSTDLHQILYATLAAITSGESFGFNRAIVMLFEEDVLKPYFAMGPRNRREAMRIWKELVQKKINLDTIIRSYTPERYEQEWKKLSPLLEGIKITREELKKEKSEIAKALEERKSRIIYPGPEDLLESKKFTCLKATEIAVAPLVIANQELGVILADNFLTRRPISRSKLVALETFVFQASLAISRALIVKQLEEKIEELEELTRLLEERDKKIFDLEKRAVSGELMNHLLHEFKNPLTVIGGLASVILEETDENDPRYPSMKAIVEEVNRMDRILKETVQGLRAQLLEKKEKVNLNELIESKVEELKKYLEVKKIKIFFKKLEGLPSVLLPRLSFEDVIEYLILNAEEAMPEGGEIHIWIERENRGISIYFRDTGKGIPEELLPRIFEPFFTTKREGLGLGLYNVKQIVRSMGGSISVISKLGEGTTFKIHLPLPLA